MNEKERKSKVLKISICHQYLAVSFRSRRGSKYVCLSLIINECADADRILFERVI